jgi:hypothetical protein
MHRSAHAADQLGLGGGRRLPMQPPQGVAACVLGKADLHRLEGKTRRRELRRTEGTEEGAARIARGPSRVPGRLVVARSKGTPTTATSAPASSLVYLRRRKLSAPE